MFLVQLEVFLEVLDTPLERLESNFIGMTQASLLKEQKVELAVWNRASREKKGDNSNKHTDGEKQGGNRKKARVASAKATTELVATMAESHTAELACITARIALMTLVGTPVAVGAAAGLQPTLTFIESQDVLNERAQVASVKLLLILKSQTKKNSKADAPPLRAWTLPSDFATT